MRKIISHPAFSFLIIGSLLSFILEGCASQGASILEVKPSRMKSIVIAGFSPVLSVGEEPGVVRGPLGTIYMAHPVSYEVAEKMTEILLNLMEEKRYDLISPGQARGVRASLLSSNPTMNEIELYQKIGKSLSADGIMIGAIYRWFEREGADFAVSRPASVAFDLYLMSSADGEIVWRGKFDKTQQSFFENLLDYATFLKSKGRWAKAEPLAEMGLKELLEKFPTASSEQETKE